ncbi:hypothetical protein I552_6755 [Mycobacterium xenopi 3993]|nr:hypothetical protein I552_6755 [Mycobacterium xenopi 3993]
MPHGAARAPRQGRVARPCGLLDEQLGQVISCGADRRYIDFLVRTPDGIGAGLKDTERISSAPARP